MQAQFLYSRGKCTDVFVPTEGQADCSKGSTLVEHLCYLRGQIACGGHQHFSKVTCPGCRLFLRSTSQKKKVTDFAFVLETKLCKHSETLFFKILSSYLVLLRNNNPENSDALHLCYRAHVLQYPQPVI